MSHQKAELQKVVYYNTQLQDDKSVVRFRVYFVSLEHKASDVEKWFDGKAVVKKYPNNSIEISLRFKDPDALSLGDVLGRLADKGFALTDEAFAKLRTDDVEVQAKLQAIPKGTPVDPYLHLFRDIKDFLNPTAKAPKKATVESKKTTTPSTTSSDQNKAAKPPISHDKPKKVETPPAKAKQTQPSEHPKEPVKKPVAHEQQPSKTLTKQPIIESIKIHKSQNGAYIRIKDDSEKLSLEQLKEWFKTYTGIEIIEVRKGYFVIELLDEELIQLNSISLVSALNLLKKHKIEIAKEKLLALPREKYSEVSFVLGGFEEYLESLHSNSESKTTKSAKSAEKISQSVSFKRNPVSGKFSFSFPIPKRKTKDKISKWFKDRVSVQLIGNNVILELGESVDGKEIMSISEVLDRLEHYGFALIHDSLVDLQNAYHDIKSQKTPQVQQLIKGLEKRFPENSWYLKMVDFTEEDIKNAIPMPEGGFVIGEDGSVRPARETKANKDKKSKPVEDAHPLAPDLMRDTIDANDEQKLRRLLGAGLSPNSVVKTSTGSVPCLLYAYQKNALNLMKVLILAGADTTNILDFIKSDTETALALAQEITRVKELSERERKILLYLSFDKIHELKGFSDYNAKSIEDWIVTKGHPWSNKDCSVFQLFGALLETATQKDSEGNNNTIDFLLAHNLCSKNNTWALFNAICAKNEALVLRLLKYGFEVNAKVAFDAEDDKNAMWHIHAAYIHGTPTIVKILLEAGADPKSLNYDGETLFQVAKREKRDDILKLFKFDLHFELVGESENRVAILRINQPYKKYKVDDIKSWFADSKSKAPLCEENANGIVLRFTDESDVSLCDALNVLAKKNLKLNNLSARALYRGALEIYEQNLNADDPIDVEIFEDLERCIEILADDHQIDYKDGIHKINERMKDVLQEKEVNKKAKADLALAKMIYPFITSVTPRRQWKAFGSTPKISEAQRFAFIKALNLEEINLDTESLSDEVRIALKNIAIYGAKLLSDMDKLEGTKKAELETKLEATYEFLRTVYAQETLTEDSLRDAYNEFEQQDVNRGTGVFRVFCLLKNEWYAEKKGEEEVSRLVKSKMGELGCIFYKAVKKQPVIVEEVEEEVDHSASFSG